jgi:hypothetical protein
VQVLDKLLALSHFSNGFGVSSTVLWMSFTKIT